MKGELSFTPRKEKEEQDVAEKGLSVEDNGILRKLATAPGMRAAIVAVLMTIAGCSKSPEQALAVESAVADEDDKATETEAEHLAERFTALAEQIPNSSFDDNGVDYFQVVGNGEFSTAERQRRWEVVSRGVEIFHDIGLDFYRVQRGDNLDKIRAKLVERYPFLRDQRRKLVSFNIPARTLQIGMLLPIPMENEDRELTDEQFTRYAYQALQSMKTNSVYGAQVNAMIGDIGEIGVIATMVAIAKQECGGKPLGQFEFHRWEPHRRRFSFSIFHILMEGPGIDARHNLNLTEGQLYHPVNACKAFLAFIFEKLKQYRDPDSTSEHPIGRMAMLDRMFPLSSDAEAVRFARFYNGLFWRRTNPNYVNNVQRYFSQANETMADLMSDDDEPVLVTNAQPIEADDAAVQPRSAPPTPVAVQSVPAVPSPAAESGSRPSAESAPPAATVRSTPARRGTPVARRESSPREVREAATFARLRPGGTLFELVRDAHLLYRRAHDGHAIYVLDAGLHSVTRSVRNYLIRMYHKDTYWVGDELRMGRDARGPYVVLRQRNRPEAIIR